MDYSAGVNREIPRRNSPQRNSPRRNFKNSAVDLIPQRKFRGPWRNCLWRNIPRRNCLWRNFPRRNILRRNIPLRTGGIPPWTIPPRTIPRRSSGGVRSGPSASPQRLRHGLVDSAWVCEIRTLTEFDWILTEFDRVRGGLESACYKKFGTPEISSMRSLISAMAPKNPLQSTKKGAP